jgi:hypothetical protein
MNPTSVTKLKRLSHFLSAFAHRAMAQSSLALALVLAALFTLTLAAPKPIKTCQAVKKLDTTYNEVFSFVRRPLPPDPSNLLSFSLFSVILLLFIISIGFGCL